MEFKLMTIQENVLDMIRANESNRKLIAMGKID